MLAAFTQLKNAERVRNYLIARQVINLKFQPVKDLGGIYFPIIQNINVPDAEVVETKFSFPFKPETITIDNLLANKLTTPELALLPRSQEIVGKIMILEVPEELGDKEKIIADSYLKLNPQISTVVKKTKMHSGVYRTRAVKILAGKKTKETVHLENGVKIKLHLEKTYFSARSGNERLRIAKLVKKGEIVLVMFSGAGPFPLVIAKNSPAKKVLGIEINPFAHQYSLNNLELNKLKDRVIFYPGEVRKVIPKLKSKFNRIVMPLPKSSEEYLDLALKKIKPGGVIHLYLFLEKSKIVQNAKRIKELCLKYGYGVKILRKVKCGQYSPSVYRVCLDLKVE